MNENPTRTFPQTPDLVRCNNALGLWFHAAPAPAVLAPVIAPPNPERSSEHASP